MGPCLGDEAEGAPRDTPQHMGLSYAPALIPAEDGEGLWVLWLGALTATGARDGDGDTAGGGWRVPTRQVVSWLVLQVRGDEHEAL